MRGYSGYNTRWALMVKEKVFPPAPAECGDGPAAVTVFFGANDACLPDRYGGFQHVPLDEYKQNLLAIVAFLKVQLIKKPEPPPPHPLPSARGKPHRPRAHTHSHALS